MFARATRIIRLTLAHGPKAVLLTRGAKRRGAVQKTEEFVSFLAFLRGRRISVAVEIGTFRGGTLWTWCRIAQPDALIISIDLPEGAFGGGYPAELAPKLHRYTRRWQKLLLIRDDSHRSQTLAEVRRILEGRQVDLLFIDGDHTYDGVKRDFAMYGSLVSDNGVIAFHDILPHPGVPNCKVDVLWEELRQTHHHIEFVDRSDVKATGQWGGIGVIFSNRRDTDANAVARRPR